MRGRKCLDALAESSFPLYNRRCVDDSRRSGNKTTSSYDIEGYRFQLLGIDISSSKVHRAELRRSLLERILSFLSVAQSVWPGYQVLIKAARARSGSLQYTLVKVVQVDRMAARACLNSGDIKISLEVSADATHSFSIASERAILKICCEVAKRLLISPCSRPVQRFMHKTHTVFRSISSSRMDDSSPCQFHIAITNSSKRFAASLCSRLQADFSIQLHVVSCHYLILLKSSKSWDAFLVEIYGRLCHGYGLLLDDVNLLALADQFRLKKFMLNLKSILDFHTYNNDGVNVVVLATVRGGQVHPRLKRYFSQQICTRLETADGALSDISSPTSQVSSGRNTRSFWTTVQQKLNISGHKRRRVLLGAPVPRPQSYQVQWNDVGGLKHVKQMLNDFIRLPLKYPKLFHQSTRGVILHGPPGTGKTLIAKATSVELGLHFFNVRGPELLGMYVGESEKWIRELFDRAKESAPSIIFFDEFDSLTSLHAAPGTLMNRVTSQIVTSLDSLQEHRVFILAASNRIEMIDPVLLRSGRLGRVLHMPRPDSLTVKSQIFEALTRNFKFKSKINVLELKELQKELTGADMYGFCVRAWSKAAKRTIRDGQSEVIMTQADFSH